jgi:hypothetical protein
MKIITEKPADVLLSTLISKLQKLAEAHPQALLEFKWLDLGNPNAPCTSDAAFVDAKVADGNVQIRLSEPTQIDRTRSLVQESNAY